MHPGGHGHGRRHHGGGRAHQPHRQKALPAGIAGRRHELCAGAGRQSGRGRCADSGRERGRARRGRAGADGAGGQGAAKRDQPAFAAGLLQRGSAGAGSAGVQRQAHRQLHQRRAGKACRHPAAVQEVRCRHRGAGHRRKRHPAQSRRPRGHCPPHHRSGAGSRHSPGGYLHRLPYPDRQRPAGGCAGHGTSAGSLQKGAGSAHRAGRVQHQLWSAMPHLPEHHLFDHGHVRRAGPCHHEPFQRGDDGGGVRLQRADQPGQAEHKVHRALCRPCACQHRAGTGCKSRACRQCRRSRTHRSLRCPDESGGKGLEG